LAQIQEQYTYTEIGINSMRAEFTLKSLILEDKWTGAAAFPNIIETKEVQE
jgi:hypothetical protein